MWEEPIEQIVELGSDRKRSDRSGHEAVNID